MSFLFMVAAAVAAPVPANQPVTETRFGITAVDDDRWMEDKANAEALKQWSLERDAKARPMLESLPKRAALLARAERLAADVVQFRGYVSSGPTAIVTRRHPGDQFSRLYLLRGGMERLLFDPNKDKSGELAGNISLSPDGKLVAFNRYKGGSEAGAIEIWTTDATPRRLERVETVWGEDRATWLDNRRYVYNRMSAPGAYPDPMFGDIAYLKTVGASGPGTPLFGVGHAPGFIPEEAGLIAFAPGARWALGYGSAARSEEKLWLGPVAALGTDRLKWRQVVTLSDKILDAAVLGDRFYTLKQQGDRTVLQVQPIRADASLGPARTLRTDRPDELLDSLHADSRDLYVKTKSAGTVGVYYYTQGNGPGRKIALPMASGDLFGIVPDNSGNGFSFGLSSWNRETGGYLLRGGRLIDTGFATPTPAEARDIMVEEGEAVSADGTRVPIVVLHGKDRPQGGWPTALMAYGGYGQSMIRPGLGRDSLPFIAEGGAFAICGVRGGGEKGAAWHQAGRGLNKPRGHEDFHACAQWLRDKKISTARGPMAIGASMGGALVGPAVLKRPDLFSGQALLSALLNPLRIEAADNGANQFDEVGDPRTADGYRGLLAMDSYNMLLSAKNPVDTLVSVGLNDRRVELWQNSKYVARFERLFPGKIWLRAESEMGHGMGTAAGVQRSEMADLYAFVFDRASR
ncbi:prolyl oligopeptidase family serine peptidase [Sphingomonas jaspsi]|uniref:prolyl oligopeptidase family serine peptidase n=1 Tax=Sphingomonas jaspsi TaxID=392409 RepID=UPI0004B2BA9D|nr:prolyl oligopeptidase family serine peptidase [Sphingomonas jaspsi]